MTKLSLALGSLLLAAFTVHAEDLTLHTFKKVQLSDQFWSEGANFGDFNNDGVMDVVIRATVLACRRVDLYEKQL